MNIVKYLLILVFIAIVSITNAQNRFNAFNLDGSPFPVDTSRVKTLQQYKDATGYKFLGSDILNDKDETIMLYQPLSYKPVIMLGKDSLSVLNSLKYIDKKSYLYSYKISSDFNDMVRLNFTRSDIIQLLGEPKSESQRLDVYTILAYPEFSVQCATYGDDPSQITVDEIVRYKLFAAKKSGIGIWGFKINVNDKDYVTGFRATFMNMSWKKIKYIYITISAVNAVKNPVATKTVKAIGPINFNETTSKSYDNLFLSKNINSIKITSLKILYIDGTVKLISGPLLLASFL